MSKRRIDVHRDVVVIGSSNYGIITRDMIVKTMANVAPDEKIVGMVERKGTHVPFGSMDGEEESYQYTAFVVRKSRLETDNEYLERMKKENKIAEDKLERDRLLYLELKARFEND